MAREPDYWGQDGQDEIFPPGTELELRAYRAPSAEWDHDHCIFCWARFIEASGPQAEEIGRDPDSLQVGYTAGPEGGEWVCPSCFDEFADRFAWTTSSG
jgi:hypothetical protein